MLKKSFLFILFCALLVPLSSVSAQGLGERLKGKILLQVESHGEAWYVAPKNHRRYYLGRPRHAFNLMRFLGIGITNANLEKIPIAASSLEGPDSDGDGVSDVVEDSLGTDKNNPDSDGDGHSDKEEVLNGYSPLSTLNKKIHNLNFANRYRGMIFLQVERNGESWYVSSTNGKRYFLGRPADAFGIMRGMGLGITNDNLNKVEETKDQINVEEPQVSSPTSTPAPSSSCTSCNIDGGSTSQGSSNTPQIEQTDSTQPASEVEQSQPAQEEPEPIQEEEETTPSTPVSSASGNESIVFLHHSTGQNVWDGGVSSWISSYNSANATNYQISQRDFPTDQYGWENYPYDYWNIWINHAGNSNYQGQPTLEILTNQYDVIAFKHCFPVSNLGRGGTASVSSSEKTIENYKLQYNALKNKLNQFPDNKFIVWTGAALIAGETDSTSAGNAREFFNWVKDTWDESGDNIFVWDFHELQTEGGLYFRDAYADGDSHPNSSFSSTVAPYFAKRIVDVIEERGDSSDIKGVVGSETPVSSTVEEETIVEEEESTPEPEEDPVEEETLAEPEETPAQAPSDSGSSSSSNTSAVLLQPSDLEYRGAFKVPGYVDNWEKWEWGGMALTAYPDGDPSGANDGYGGSLYGTGHEWHQNISELSIPTPVVSGSKNLGDLNTAGVLQDFEDVSDGVWGALEMPRVGLEYLPAQGSQTEGKIYYGYDSHLNEGDTGPSHGWFSLDLSNANRQGDWRIDGAYRYNSSDYMFSIPEEWADENVSGKILATGRYRDGGQGSQGPVIYAIAPWNEGNPPAAGSSISKVTLLEYDNSYEADALYTDSARTLNGYHHSDEWTGGAWLTSGDKSAVIFVGNKGFGDFWYGDGDGPCLDCAGSRGWWSDRWEGQIIFYNPDDLADVASGAKEPWEPQPYAVLNIDDILYSYEGAQVAYRTGGVAFDRERGLLYVVEFNGDYENERPLIHVWKVN